MMMPRPYYSAFSHQPNLILTPKTDQAIILKMSTTLCVASVHTGPVVDQNLLPFPMCRFLLNWRNDTATVNPTDLPKNKPPPTPSTLVGNILNALVTLQAAVWYRGWFSLAKITIGTENVDFCLGLRLAK